MGKKVAEKIKVKDEDDKSCPNGKPPCSKCHEGAIYNREKKHCERSTDKDFTSGTCCKPAGLKPRRIYGRTCDTQEGEVDLKYCNGQACPGAVRKCYDDDEDPPRDSSNSKGTPKKDKLKDSSNSKG